MNDDVGQAQGDEDEDIADIMQEISEENDLFHFIPLEVPAIGQEGPGPSTLAHGSRAAQSRVLDDDEDSRVEDIYDGAAKVIRMNDNLYERWRKSFGQDAEEDSMDVDDMDWDSDSGEKDRSFFYPFHMPLPRTIRNTVHNLI